MIVGQCSLLTINSSHNLLQLELLLLTLHTTRLVSCIIHAIVKSPARLSVATKMMILLALRLHATIGALTGNFPNILPCINQNLNQNRFVSWICWVSFVILSIHFVFLKMNTQLIRQPIGRRSGNATVRKVCWACPGKFATNFGPFTGVSTDH